MILSSVGMLLTFRCTAACAHCCFEAGPERTDAMAPEDAVRFVHQVAQAGGEGVVFTGGEPFIDYACLRSAVTEAGRLGLHIRIVTNGFWALSEQRARLLLEPLRDAGLNTLTVSCDEAHEQHVPRERTKNAILTALDLGLRVIISSAALAGDPVSNAAALAGRLDLDPHPSLWVKAGYMSPNGRAAFSYDPSSFARLDIWKDAGRLDRPCPFVVAQPVVTPAGDLAACCSPATATRTGFRREFVIGNLHDNPFQHLQQELETDPLFLFLMLRGPWALLQVADGLGIQLDPGVPIVNQCDLCANLLCSGTNASRLRESVAALEFELRLQALHLLAVLGDRRDAYLETGAGLQRFSAACDYGAEESRQCPS